MIAEDFATWVQQGRAFLWRYDPSPSGLRGWHFTADQLGCESLTDLMERLGRAPAAAKRTVSLSAPTPEIAKVPGDYPGRKIIAGSKLRIAVNQANASDHWQIDSDGDEVQLTLGVGQLEKLGEALAQVRIGEGDFSLGSLKLKDQGLWFWWMPRSK